MHHPTDRIAHITAFVTPVVEHWLEREIAQWVHPMKDRSDDPSHYERTLPIRKGDYGKRVLKCHKTDKTVRQCVMLALNPFRMARMNPDKLFVAFSFSTKESSSSTGGSQLETEKNKNTQRLKVIMF